VGRGHIAQRELRPEEVVRLEDDRVVILDQRRLPADVVELECFSAAEVAEAISTLAVRGAPAIGVAAAMGYALAAARGENLDDAAAVLLAARPTAVNIAWALSELRRGPDDPQALADRARELHRREVARCVAMGEHAASMFGTDAAEWNRPLTHCNTGALATGGHGSALGAIRSAHALGLVERVLVDETRPLLQGSRLTAWELERAGIAHRVIVDGAAGALMAQGEVSIVVVGADRIAACGDVANKIGTYMLAVLAARHEIPFVVAAPSSTIDLATPNGERITIEERDPNEVSERFAARNPAFDVTPASLVTAIVTEAGVHRPPFQDSLAQAVATSGHSAPSGGAGKGGKRAARSTVRGSTGQRRERRILPPAPPGIGGAGLGPAGADADEEAE
jgi:methylthioribose-1-phosphate isomerase